MITKTSSKRRERSRNAVLIALQKEPKRFTDLVKDEEVNLSAVGLTSILKILSEDDEIQLELIDNKKKYVLTNKGTISVSNLNFLSIGLANIISRDGKYYSTYSRLQPSMLSSSLPWGIESDLIVDKEIDSLNLLSRSDVLEIEELLFRKLSKHIPKRKLEQKLVGQMILGFTIDYPELIKSVEKQSLDYVRKMSKEESRLLNKYENDPESLTTKELSRMNELRKETTDKLKKSNL
ncbi:MAG: hypothetical protein J4F36_07470 [Nitrosopumilaceae archaeon]|nr:hypothetical protein [Nitrosopumilaceae archaeon]